MATLNQGRFNVVSVNQPSINVATVNQGRFNVVCLLADRINISEDKTMIKYSGDSKIRFIHKHKFILKPVGLLI